MVWRNFIKPLNLPFILVALGDSEWRYRTVSGDHGRGFYDLYCQTPGDTTGSSEGMPTDAGSLGKSSHDSRITWAAMSNSHVRPTGDVSLAPCTPFKYYLKATWD